jgi:ankyrin repeat protein
MYQRDIELPLVVACKEGNTEVVRVLLEKNADPNQYLMGNWSPMEAAIIGRSKERFQIVQMLQEKGADVNLFGSRQSALFAELQALMFKKDPTPQDLELSREIITFFITNGASTAGNLGNTMLHYLSYTGDLSLLDAFYPECAQYMNIQDNQGETPLMWAISGEKTDAVRWLLDKGADRSIVDANGKTAYDHAVENGYLEIAELLKNE